jgi:hypothetical protein
MGNAWTGECRSCWSQKVFGRRWRTCQFTSTHQNTSPRVSSTRNRVKMLRTFTLKQHADVSETIMQPSSSRKLVHAYRCLRCLPSPHSNKRLIPHRRIGKTFHYSHFRVRFGQIPLGRFISICRSPRSRDLTGYQAGQAWMTTSPWL